MSQAMSAEMSETTWADKNKRVSLGSRESLVLSKLNTSINTRA